MLVHCRAKWYSHEDEFVHPEHMQCALEASIKHCESISCWLLYPEAQIICVSHLYNPKKVGTGAKFNTTM